MSTHAGPIIYHAAHRLRWEEVEQRGRCELGVIFLTYRFRVFADFPNFGGMHADNVHNQLELNFAKVAKDPPQQCSKV